MTDESTDNKTNGRPRTRGEERVEAIKTPSRSELLARAEELEHELAAAREPAEEHMRSWQRAAADFSNYRRRTEEDRAAVMQLSNALLLTKLLGVLDDFDR